jgi:hypothetical protein
MRPAPFPCALAVVTLLLLTGCGNGPFSQTEALTLQQAQARWSALGPEHYTIEMRRLCFCGPDVTDWATIEVDHDTLVRVTQLTGDSLPHASWWARPPVAQIFREIRTYRPGWLKDVRASYDSAAGFPTMVNFTPDDGIIDGGYGYEARALTVLVP